MKFRALAAAAAASALAVTLSVAPAQGHYKEHKTGSGVSNVKVVAEGLAGPLRVDFGPRGSLLVAESGSGSITSISAKGKRTTIVNAPGYEVAGVSYRHGATYYFQNPAGAEQAPDPKDPALLKAVNQRGKTRTLADLAAFERKHDPDGKTVYGVRDVSKRCLAQAPELQSRGEVYSHPYASVPTGSGVYVADAGANAILHVGYKGKVKLVKALPAEPIKITAQVREYAVGNGIVIPDCMMGKNYWAQAVPTDIAVRGSWMYYTVLPGAPGEELAQGKVYKMNLHTKKSYQLASGLSAPTGVAVSGSGQVYVAEIFGGGVSKIVRGKAVPVLPATMASDVAVRGNKLAATTDVFGAGKLVSARIR